MEDVKRNFSREGLRAHNEPDLKYCPLSTLICICRWSAFDVQTPGAGPACECTVREQLEMAGSVVVRDRDWLPSCAGPISSSLQGRDEGKRLAFCFVLVSARL